MEKIIKKYNLTNADVQKIKKESKIKNPEILKQHIIDLIKCLSLNVDEIREILIKYPNMLTYSTETILEKQETFINNFGFTEEEFKNLIVKAPEIISLGIKNIENKYQFLNEMLFVSKNDFKRMILKHPAILSYSKDALNKKINIFLKNELSPKEIIANPIMLSLSTASFTTRLAICKYFRISLNTFISKRLFMENDEKLYSNLMYLKEKNLAYSRYNLIAKKLPISRAIKNLYPFNKDAKKKVFECSDVYDENGNQI